MCWKGPLNPSSPEGKESFPEAAHGVKANPTHQQHPIPPETFCGGAGCPALPWPVLASTHTSPATMAQTLSVSLESMLVVMEEAWASLQALGPSLSKGAKASWWLQHLGRVPLS